MNNTYQFIFQQYSLFPYEKELAKKEISSLFNTKNIQITNDGYKIKSYQKLEQSQILRFTFFRKIIEGNKQETIPSQVFFENSAKTVIGKKELVSNISLKDIVNLSGRKESKYSLHGFHNYKGKFYPQLAKSLINIYLPDKSGIVLDPFCGSGTSLFEANSLGFDAIGLDLHPLAVKIADVKTKSPNWNKNKFKTFVNKFTKSLKDYNSECDYSEKYEGDLNYLKNWFSSKILNKLFYLYNKILQNKSSTYFNFLEIILSDILRECSHQDPKQLRIYKRKDFLKDYDVFSVFIDNLIKESNKVIAYNSVKPDQKYGKSLVYNYDSRELTKLKSKNFPNGIDLVVTSPPYATALPYIDTDRLSLFFFNLISKETRRKLESDMVGNREITNKQRIEFESKMKSNLSRLPKEIYDLIFKIYTLNSKSDVGFRKKNTAGLLYKYFSDMKEIMNEVYIVLKTRGKFLIVIGNNYTVAGDQKIIINNDRLIESMAKQIGFKIHTSLDITVTAQNLVHLKNFIKKNRVVVLERI